jgi:CubicO group peptidase (beta-lactamase class C family)
MIVERVSREPYTLHVARTILRPLGMDATYFYSDVLDGRHTTTMSARTDISS